jgi:thioredoxin-like negative regulator of GroEL
MSENRRPSRKSTSTRIRRGGRFGVRSIPTLILFKGGQPVNQFVGLQRKDTLVDAVRQTSGN